MTKIAVISDIHSNLPALKKVLADIKNRKNIEEIICLGDIVGYYAWPNECVDLVKENCSISIMGNHDAGVIEKLDINYFTPTAKRMIHWTKSQLSLENLEWLSSLSYEKTIEYNDKSVYLVHGKPNDPFDYLLPYTAYKIEDKYQTTELVNCFNIAKTDMLLVGHTHSPVIAKLNKGSQLFMNPGSVGQPRHGVAGAYYGIIDVNSFKAELIHLKYNLEPVEKKMTRLSLPISLVERLKKGL